MGSHRQGRLLVVSLLALGACKSTRKDEGAGAKPPAAEPAAGGEESSAEADPHAGIDMGGGGGDPHAGIDMGGGGGGGGGELPTRSADGWTQVGAIALHLPDDWKAEPTTSGMRKAQWKIPAAKGAGEAELVAFYFGPQGAGTVADNIQRWAEQFDVNGQPAQPKKSTREVGGMPVTTVELEGRYVAAMSPGAPEKNDKPDTMMLGFIVETKEGPYYYKLTGPKATVQAVRTVFAEAVANLRPATP
ncbi:MAG TPA: hypothetical protein VMZ28_24470 [Kofleriaceae bacterium]|nr:hypothetical protein [Kofleriaceae bacterium]